MKHNVKKLVLSAFFIVLLFQVWENPAFSASSGDEPASFFSKFLKKPDIKISFPGKSPKKQSSQTSPTSHPTQSSFGIRNPFAKKTNSPSHGASKTTSVEIQDTSSTFRNTPSSTATQAKKTDAEEGRAVSDFNYTPRVNERPPIAPSYGIAPPAEMSYSPDHSPSERMYTNSGVSNGSTVTRDMPRDTPRDTSEREDLSNLILPELEAEEELPNIKLPPVPAYKTTTDIQTHSPSISIHPQLQLPEIAVSQQPAARGAQKLDNMLSTSSARVSNNTSEQKKNISLTTVDHKSGASSNDIFLPDLPESRGLQSVRSETRVGNAISANMPNSQESDPNDVMNSVKNLELSVPMSPQILVDTTGPQRISLGNTGIYRVQMRNASSVEAKNIVVKVVVPASASISSVNAEVGTVNFQAESNAVETICEWHIPKVGVQESHDLTLKITPKTREAFALDVSWSCLQTSRQKIVQIQEPRLTLKIDGPENVLENKPEIYSVRVINTGECSAESIKLRILPSNSENSAVISQDFGSLEPGQQRVQTVELTAKKSGIMVVHAEVNSGEMLVNTCDKSVNVVIPRLEINAPPLLPQAVGTECLYRFSVRNAGTGNAENVRVMLHLPQGMTCVSADSIGEVYNKRDIIWNFKSLPATSGQDLSLRLYFSEPGTQNINLKMDGNHCIPCVEDLQVKVDALASLKMTLNTPDGISKCNMPDTYELTIMNTGSVPVKDAMAVVFFSDGIEPVQANGGKSKIMVGQVHFITGTILPQQKSVYHITARANIPGNHVIHAELKSAESHISLIQRETVIYRK